MIDETLGPYKVLEQLGAGGMGEVYLAEDTRLGRKVAIKVLPAEFASDPERRARFEREARAAAALNHPHIAVVHDIGTEGDTHFIVQEYLEGHSLRSRLDKGALSLEQTLDLAVEVGEALIAAHKAGIIHRDLKPDNVFVTEEGHAKVLDFGLAKLTEVASPQRSELTVSPTELGTVAGQIVGTAGYMAPEQVNGLQVDERADLFAFGCVLYEMITGRRAFSGENVHETLALILSDAPAPIADIRDSAPAELQRIVRKALAKRADRRYQTAVDLNLDLRQLREDAAVGSAVAPASQEAANEAGARPVAPRGGSWTTVGIVALIAALAAGTAIWALMGHQVPGLGPGRFPLRLPSGTTVPRSGNQLAVSPDGRTIVFAADDSQTRQLYMRPLDQLDPEPLPGTVGASRPFFSPDGGSVAFNVDGDLKVVSLAGGEPVTLCEGCASGGSDGTWHGDRIIFDRDGSLREIPATGAVSSTLVAEPDAERGEAEYDRPDFLPTGEAIVFELRRAHISSLEDGEIAHLDLESGVVTKLAEEGADPVSLPSGHVLYARGTTLYGLRVDWDRVEPIGPAMPLVERVRRDYYAGSSHFAVSSTGVLAYLPGTTVPEPARTLVWVDEGGNENELAVPPGGYDRVRVSPDGTRIAMVRRSGPGGQDIWILGNTFAPLTRVGFNISPAWSPDSSKIAFSSRRPGTSGHDVYVAPLNGSEAPSALHSDEQNLWPVDQMEDGRIIVLSGPRGARSSDDVMLLDVDDEPPLQAILNSESREVEARLSPTSDWLAYTSDQSGRMQVYIQRLSDSESTLAVSPAGGHMPAWSPDGSVLYYRYEGRMWAASLDFDTDPPGIEPRALFSTAPYLMANGIVPYDIDPVTGRFLMIKQEVSSTDATAPADAESAAHIVVVLNWFEELTERMSRGR